MKKWIILISFFGIWKESVSQDEHTMNSLVQEAHKYYAEEQYNVAIQLYRELTDRNTKNADVIYHLAESYRRTFNYTEAEAYYLKVCYLAPEQFPLAMYYYALMLKFNANFDESIVFFDEFISRQALNESLKEYIEQAAIDNAGCETAKTELIGKEKENYILTSLKINTAFNDYAPAVRDSTSIVITSGRVTSNRQSIDERYGEGFTDNFYFEKHGTDWHDRTKQVFSITNTKYNDGSGCFNSRGDKYYFTVCGMEGPQCRLFLSVLKNNKWSEPIPLNSNVNYRSSESKHPAISKGGDTLVFASNRKGSYGQFDLWMCINSGNENWGPAINLGSSINTKLNELSPSFTTFSYILFFASDGHQGYGGLDIYMAKKLSTGDTVLYNLDHPFNSNRDDCFISFSHNALYVSSNRSGGRGGFDVFSVRIPSVIAFISRLSLKKNNARRDINLKSKTGNTQRLNLQASRLEEKIDYDNLTYEKKRIVDEMVNERIRNNPNTKEKFGGISQDEFDILNKLADERYREYLGRKRFASNYLTRIKSPDNTSVDLTVTGTLSDSLSGRKLSSLKIMVTDSLGEVLKITSSNENGKFRFTDVPAGQELYLRLENTVQKDDVRPVISQLEIAGSGEQSEIYFENVYFDFDHYTIRPEASKVLDALATYLIRNPAVQVEIFAFADDRGSNEYNIRLTQKRGQSVVEYLISKGVDQTGLAIIAKGKQVQPETDSELQRQYNRRIEFYLNGNTEVFFETARTYILKKKIDWTILSRVTGIIKEELKTLNGATDEQLNAFQPVRIPLQAKAISPELFFIGL